MKKTSTIVKSSDKKLTLRPVQHEIIKALKETIALPLNAHRSSGLIKASVRSGKTACIIMFLKYLFNTSHYSTTNKKILWLVYDKDERDGDLKDDFIKWGAEDLFNKYIWAIHPSSLKRYKEEYKDKVLLVLYNECHTISKIRAKILKEYIIDNNIPIIGMTGTFPEDNDKANNLANVNIGNNSRSLIYNYGLDKAAKEGVIKNYNIDVYQIPMSTNKDITINYTNKDTLKKDSFLTSEKASIEYYLNKLKDVDIEHEPYAKSKLEITNKIDSFKEYKLETHENKAILRNLYTRSAQLSDIMRPGWNIKKNVSLMMLRPLTKLKSKVNYAKTLINDLVINQQKRVIVFALDTEHALAISNNDVTKVYNSKTDRAAIDNFELDDSSKPGYLILNEKASAGYTFLNVDDIILLNVNSSNTKFVQKMGRGLLLDSDKVLNVHVLISKDTPQLKWFQKAVTNLDKTKINYK